MNNLKKQIRKFSKSHENGNTLLIGRRLKQGFDIKLSENIDRAENVTSIYNERIEIFNGGIEGNIFLKFGDNNIKIPIRKKPLGKNEDGNTDYGYYSVFESSGLKMEFDLSQIKTNIGVKSNKDLFNITRNELYLQKKVDFDDVKSKIPSNLSLKEIYNEENDFKKLALLAKRRSFLQNIINKKEEIIKTNNALCYQANSFKRTPEQIANIEELNNLKMQRDDCITKIREVESDIQQNSDKSQKFMHSALKVLDENQLEKILKNID